MSCRLDTCCAFVIVMLNTKLASALKFSIGVNVLAEPNYICIARFFSRHADGRSRLFIQGWSRRAFFDDALRCVVQGAFFATAP